LVVISPTPVPDSTATCALVDVTGDDKLDLIRPFESMQREVVIT